jgi:peptidoglycan/LPS O-acetylase OafA/YrhL
MRPVGATVLPNETSAEVSPPTPAPAPLPSRPPADAAGGRLAGVDLLRGAACLLVVLYHVGSIVLGGLFWGWDRVLGATPGWLRPAIHLSRLGFSGVSMFLVLSGFCLAFPHFRRAEQAGDTLPAPLRPLSFARDRALRLLPPYYLTMLVLWGLYSLGGVFKKTSFLPIEAWDVGVHALLLHNLHPNTIWSINGVYWSLALEAQLYLAFLLVLPAFARAPLATFLGSLAVSVVVPLGLARAFDVPNTGAPWAVCFESMPAHLFEFVCGVAGAKLVVSGRRPPRALLLALAPLWVLAATWSTVWKTCPPTLDRLISGLSFGACAVLVARVRVPDTWLGRAVVLPGLVSYSLYLLHQPILLVLAVPISERWPALDARLFVCVFGLVPLLVGASWLLYRLVEKPFQRGGWAHDKLT